MEFELSIKLWRFKPSGKWYDEVTFATNSNQVWQIAGEIRDQMKSGLISDGYDYLILGTDFDAGFPHLVRRTA